VAGLIKYFWGAVRKGLLKLVFKSILVYHVQYTSILLTQISVGFCVGVCFV
jgi:hypothetical protein